MTKQDKQAQQAAAYGKMSKPELLALITERDDDTGAKMLAAGRKVTKAILVAWLIADDNRGRGMSATLLRYRTGYQDTVSSTNRPSLHNGDEVAVFLAGATPEFVMAAADKLLGLGDGFCAERYSGLNPGQQRMNSGNRIRMAAKRGDITIAQITAYRA